jgi:hypothetical protein
MNQGCNKGAFLVNSQHKALSKRLKIRESAVPKVRHKVKLSDEKVNVEMPCPEIAWAPSPGTCSIPVS